MHIRLKTLLLLVSPPLLLVAAAYIQWGTVGLPTLAPIPELTPATAVESYGFPAWLRITHYINFMFLILLIRSGLQVLADHPRLYWNVHCTPGTEWLRLTPIEVPKDRVWTAKDDARHLTPWIGLPGYRHTVGMARHWHFLSVLFWVGNGVAFVVLLFATPQWQRLVPTSWKIVPDAWAVFVHYATFHLPPEPDGFYHYNALQQLAYFAAVFILAPLAIVTGPSMSPAFTARFSPTRCSPRCVTRSAATWKSLPPPPEATHDRLAFGRTGALRRDGRSRAQDDLPGIYAMAKRDALKVPVIGVAAPKWSLAHLRDRVKDSIKRSGMSDNQRALRHLLSLLSYVSGDYSRGICAGKCLAETAHEVLVELKPPPQDLFADSRRRPAGPTICDFGSPPVPPSRWPPASSTRGRSSSATSENST